MKKRWIVNVINFTIFFLLVTVLWYFLVGKEWIEKKNSNETPVAAYDNITYSGWLVDWDWEHSLTEASYVLDSLSSVQLFIGYFDSSGNFIWNERQEQLVEQYKQRTANNQEQINKEEKIKIPEIYLTVVNDVLYEDGRSTQKSNELVANITNSILKQEQLIDQWVSIIKQHELAGIELDFENMSIDVWQQYLHFVRNLYLRLHDEQLELRVVIEAKTPFDKLEWPEGPQYVVTAYNLFGLHSGPGAKADKSFIGKLTAKMEALPGQPAVAIATGGFLWKNGAEAIAIKESEIDQYVPSDSAAIRDDNSQALYIQYKNNGVDYELWYADDVTLNYWIEQIVQRGYADIAIWRFGNNNVVTLENVVK